MMTYLIETTCNSREVLQYADLNGCKKYLKESKPYSVCMLAIEGINYGEGFHKYRLYWNGVNFKRSIQTKGIQDDK